MELHYTKEEITEGPPCEHPTIRMLEEDWLKQDVEIQRLRELVKLAYVRRRSERGQAGDHHSGERVVNKYKYKAHGREWHVVDIRWYVTEEDGKTAEWGPATDRDLSMIAEIEQRREELKVMRQRDELKKHEIDKWRDCVNGRDGWANRFGRLREELRDAETLTAGAVRAESENNAGAWSTLRDAAAVVVEEVYAGGVVSIVTVEALALVAGIKAPPQDGDAGDRADEAYEAKGNR